MRHRHHLTGRVAPGGPYLDPALVVVVSPSRHADLHVCLRSLGLEFPAPGADLERHRRLRIAAQIQLLVDELEDAA